MRLLAFAAGLVAVFVLALVGARAVAPTDLAQAGPARTGHNNNSSEGDTQMDHHSATTPSAPHSEDPHTEHGQASSVDPVRGLSVAQDGYQLSGLTGPGPSGRTAPWRSS